MYKVLSVRVLFARALFARALFARALFARALSAKVLFSKALLIVAVVSAVCAYSAAAADESKMISDSPEAKRAYEQAALTKAGSVENGRRLFFEDNRTKCSACHRVGSEGNNVGPELTNIGGKFDRPHLVESLLEPSRQIVEGYRPTNFLTADGTVVIGIVKERSASQVKLVNADGKEVLLNTASIETEKVSDVSMMPTGLTSSLSLDEFADVVAYLESLRSGKQKFGAGISGPITLPADFAVKTITTGLSGAVALEVLPDNRILVCEQGGTLRVIRDGKLLDEPFVTLPVHLEWERGLIGVTVDPDFATQPYVYVCYVAKEPYIHHVVSRFLADGDVAKPGSEQILIVGDDQSKLGGNVPAGHQGGALHFGPDKCLYIAIGEQTAGLPAQELNTFQGKILRIHRDGSIPSDNPLLDKTEGKYQAIWAYGLRNPFTFAIQPVTGQMLMNDVGGNFEEINRGLAGANYGWPTVEHGPTDDPRFVSPIHIYPQASISGGDFVPANSRWPAQYQGKYLFADFVHGWIHAIDPASANAVTANEPMNFAEGLRRPVDMRFGRDGKLYVLLRNAWVVDDKFVGGTGSLLSIDYQPERRIFRDRSFNYGAADNVMFTELDPDTKRKFEGHLKWAANKKRRVPKEISLDIEKAVAAEVLLEYWGGHIGTSKQRFQINDGEWIDIPQPQGTPTEPQRFYRTLLGNNRTPIPLESLKQGSNIFRFEAGKQIAYSFDFGFYGIYDFTVRVFLSDDHPHPTGTVATIGGLNTFDETLDVELRLDASPNGKIARVDFIGQYDDFDWDGDGVWHEYQFTSHHGQLRHHLGTATEAPWRVQWDAKWIPDQSGPVKIRAIITDETGVSYLTSPIEVQQKRSQRKVVMVKPKIVPEKFSSRDSKESAACLIEVADDVTRVSSAKLRLSTWSGNVDDDSQHELRLNGKKLAERFGAFHNYSLDTLDVPIDFLRSGTNEITLYSTFKGHSLEVNWPGPVLLLEFESKSKE